MNKITPLARELVVGGLKREDLFFLPPKIAQIAAEVFAVPERPESYQPRFELSKPDIAVLVTGGLDSTTLYFRARSEFSNVKAFYVDIGQPYVGKELQALSQLGIEYELIADDVSYAGDYWKHIIPARNFYLLSLVAERIHGGKILFGAVDGEMPQNGGDKSREFLRLVNDLFGGLPFPVQVETPLAAETKTDLVSWWLQNLPVELLDKTVTCFGSGSGHCGTCQSCLRKWIAYYNNGLTLRTDCDVRLGCREYIEKYQRVMSDAIARNDFSHYSKRRCEQTLRAIQILI